MTKTINPAVGHDPLSRLNPMTALADHGAEIDYTEPKVSIGSLNCREPGPLTRA